MDKCFVVAGGTGGHIFPAMAVAVELQKQGVHIEWIGARGRLEEKIVPDKFSISYIDIAALRGKSKLSILVSPFRITKAIFQSLSLLRKHKPSFVLAMGGYVCGPMGIAAWLLRIPLVLHEQNAAAGFTNRQLARFATTVMQAFPNSFANNEGIAVVGNPVRDILFHVPPPEQRFADRQGGLRVLIMGGSQGARFINQQMIALLESWPDKNTIDIWHQCGATDHDTVIAEYKRIGFDAKVTAFIDDVSQAYSWADCVICRAGALTVSELAAVGAASILIPLPIAVDDHQRLNAEVLQHVGGAEILLQKNWQLSRLAELLQQLNVDRQKLLQMAVAAKSAAKPDATDCVVRSCMNLLEGKPVVTKE
ncbi:MAG: undecaprenyldiphospho-muramoylpentapeptide beta-N-acetylglucosaminyltransferase [Coxiellaceae bacterium]|nr:undecaprenyldiphospho-muramoylpentapeptide beta-N-acetylglucosaminyltransferase [Coxiellaceae bacterium]